MDCYRGDSLPGRRARGAQFKMHPTDAIFHWAKHCPRHLAVLLPNMAITYQALAEAIEVASERIERLGFDNGGTVAVAIGDPGKFLAVCLALLYKGITCAPVSTSVLPYLRPNNINTLIFSGHAGIEGGRNIRFNDSWLLREDAAFSEIAPNKNSGSYGDLIFFTSGTTGAPKKVVVSSDALIERVGLVAMTEEAVYTRVLVLPGLSSGFGFNRAVPLLYAGKTVCFAHGPDAQLRFINTFDIEVIVASIQQASDLVAAIEQGAKYRSESLEEVWISGGFASKDLVRRIQSSLCRNVKIVYGSSESGFVASASYNMISHEPSAVGFVLPSMQVEIVDETGTVLRAGQEGLVRGRSSYIAKIFAANHSEGVTAASDPWWYSGDLGRLTEDGILCISGRTDDLLNMGGVKVAAESLDEQARRYPGVKDAGVCAVLGQSGMDEAWFGIVSDDRIDLSDFKKWIEERQNEPIRVGEILVVDRIPRSELGKLQRHELKALLLAVKSRALSGA